MTLLDSFHKYLTSQKNPSSKITVKNYLSDLRTFTGWYQQTFKQEFLPRSLTPELIKYYKEYQTSAKNISFRSLERHLSSIRKFAAFLLTNGEIHESPFSTEIKQIPDEFGLKQFKNFLYEDKLSDQTTKNYIMDVRQFMNWVKTVSGIDQEWNLTEKNIYSKLSPEIFDEYKQRLLRDKGMAAVSVNRKLSSIRRYLDWTKSTGLVSGFRFQVSGIPPETSSKGQDQEQLESFKNSLEQQTKYPLEESVYSSIPPVRLYQKVSKGMNGVAGILLLEPLAKGIEKLNHKTWKLKGGELFREVENNKEERLVNPPDLIVPNISKSFYSPLTISTKSFPLHKKLIHHARYNRPDWYKKYHNYPIVHYVHFGVLIIFVVGIGLLFYNNLFEQAANNGILAAQPTSPPRTLSFQGRLTDSSDNAIASAKDLRFALYTSTTGTGSAKIWEEVNTVTPDSDGIFSVILGKNIKMQQDVFGDHAELYLGVTVGTDAELKPRQQLATVAYATNAEVLQGLPPITEDATKTTNVVLALNSSGNLIIGGTGAPTFQATGGQFKLLGQPLVLGTNVGSNGNVQLAPDGLGKIDLQKPLHNTSNNNNVATALGAVEINDLFAVLATSSGQSAFTIEQQGGGPIISASASGVARFTVENVGNLLVSASSYYNWGTTSGTSGYGLRDNNGTIQYKNSAGSWSDISSAASAGGWTDDGSVVRLSTASDNVGIGTTTVGSGIKLDVVGNSIRTDTDIYSGDLYLGYDDTSATISTQDTDEGLTIDPNGTGTITLTAPTVTLSGTTALTATSLTSITGGATAIDFTEFDVVAGTGSITINDGGDAGQVSVEGSIFDINSLDFVGNGLLTTTGILTLTPSTTLNLNSTGDLTADSSTDIILDADGADVILKDGGTTFATLTNSSTDLTLDIAGGQLNLADADVFNIGGLTGVAYNALSDSGGATSQGLASDDDLYIEGDLEVDGTLYIDGASSIDTAFTAGSVVFAGTSGVLAQDNSNFFWDDSSNELGIGTTSPGGGFHLYKTLSTNQEFGIGTDIFANTAATGYYGLTSTAYATHISGTITNLYGNFSQALQAGTAATTNLYGGLFRTGIGGTSPSNTVASSYGLYVDSPANNAGGSPAVTMTNLYGLRIANQGVSTTGITKGTAYGLYVDAQSGASTANYAAVFEGGNVGIGITAPTALLHLAQNGTTGEALEIYRDLGAASTDSPLALITQNNTGDDTTLLQLIQKGTGNVFLAQDTDSDTTPFVIDAAGNVGIGTTSTAGLLDVRGDTYLGQSSGATDTYINIRHTANQEANLRFLNFAGTGYDTRFWLANDNSFNFSHAQDTSNPDPLIKFSGYGGMQFKMDENSDETDRVISFLTNGSTELVRIQEDGNVGIGSTTVSSKLHVTGGDIRVTTGSFIDDGVTLTAPDYVFEPGYNMKSLEEVEAYVNQNYHLPGVPSRAEFKRDGIRLTELSFNLLEKVEELTLYSIDQNKKLKELSLNQPNSSQLNEFGYLTLESKGSDYQLRQQNGSIITRFGAFSDAIIANLRVGTAHISTLATDSLTISSESVTIAGMSLRSYITQVVNQELRIKNQEEFVSPIASTERVLTNVISPLSSDSVVLDGKLLVRGNKILNQVQDDKVLLEVQNASGSAVATIDSTGNARFAGDLEARRATFSGQLASNGLGVNGDATISGTLRAGKILAEDIEGLQDRISTLAAQQVVQNITNVYNTVSTPSAKTEDNSSSESVIASDREAISGKIATSPAKRDPRNDNVLSSLLKDVPTDFVPSASFSGSLAALPTFSAEFGKFTESLISLGPTSLIDTSIFGTLSINHNFTLADNSINVVGSDLEIQPLRQGGVSLLSGRVFIDRDGNATFSENATFAKDVTVKGKLAANILSPLPDSDLNVILGSEVTPGSDSGQARMMKSSKFMIQDASGSGVLSIDQKGNVNSSGSASFKDLLAKTLTIVRSAQADTSLTETIATSSAGTATIITGEIERTIITPFVTADSLIYLTPVTNTQGITPYVARQTIESDGVRGSFTIQIPKRQYEDVKVNWWIIN